jgi:signal transduction histidine kinase
MTRERSRLAREIHDSLAQGFTAVSVQLEMAKHKLPPGAAGAQDHLEAARGLVRESLAEARRSIQGLRHGVLTNEDFLAALRQRGTTILRDTPVTLECAVTGDIPRLGAAAANELLRIATEAMTNTVKHAGAHRIRVTYREADGRGELSIADDGAGLPAGAGASAGFGLRGMRERAEQINGSLVVNSPPGRGTEILVRLPLEAQP